MSPLGESHPSRIQLLETLAGFWQQDGNLLKALSYWEKAVSAIETTLPEAEQPRPGAMRRAEPKASRGGNHGYLYQELADLYSQLGRPEAAAKALAILRSLAQDDPTALAAYYEREGDLDQAVALYQKAFEQAAANPQPQIWGVIGLLQSIAGLYESEHRWMEASAALELAAGRLDGSNSFAMRRLALGMRLNRANLLQRAGQSQAAEVVYQELLADVDNSNGPQLPVLQEYARQLANTNRADQGEHLLKTFLANHTDLQPGQQAEIFFSLEMTARSAGRKELADEYHRTAIEKHRTAQAHQSADGQLIDPDLGEAQRAANRGDLDEALHLALRALASAPLAPDRELVAWQIPSIASALAARKAPDRAERLYRELFPLLRTWSVDNTTPLLQALQEYARFLIGQKDRWGEAPAAIERYRESLVAAQGAESGDLEQVIQLRIDLARASGARADALQGAEDLLDFEESLSGTTSVRYMHAARRAADVYQSGGRPERALTLHRQIVAIADLSLPASDAQRGHARILLHSPMRGSLTRRSGWLTKRPLSPPGCARRTRLHRRWNRSGE